MLEFTIDKTPPTTDDITQEIKLANDLKSHFIKKNWLLLCGMSLLPIYLIYSVLFNKTFTGSEWREISLILAIAIFGSLTFLMFVANKEPLLTIAYSFAIFITFCLLGAMIAKLIGTHTDNAVLIGSIIGFLPGVAMMSIITVHLQDVLTKTDETKAAFVPITLDTADYPKILNISRNRPEVRTYVEKIASYKRDLMYGEYKMLIRYDEDYDAIQKNKARMAEEKEAQEKIRAGKIIG